MINVSAESPKGFTLQQSSAFHDDNEFISEMRALLKPSYKDVEMLLNRELNHNKYIYYLRDKDGMLSSFFMSNFDIIDNEVVSYMGLMAVAEKYKGLTLAAPIIIPYIENLRRKERELGRKILSYATTATISSYKCLALFCDDYQPTENGCYTVEGKQAARYIAHHLKLNYNTNHPFILKRVAKGTSYSELEKKRINNIIQRKRFHLFEQLGIEEENGDRLLLFGFKLSEEKYRRWITKCHLPVA